MLLQKKNATNAASQYVSPTGELPNRTLRLGAWYVAHKIQLQHIGTGLLIAWCVATIGFSIYQWGEYLFVGVPHDDALLRAQAQLPNYRAIQSAYQARDLTFSDVRVFRSAEAVYTFMAGVVNPNARHVAHIQYKFVFSGGETAVTDAIILPGQTRDVAVFGVASAQYPTDARLVVLETKWKRVDPHRVPNVAEYVAKRSMFTIDHFIFVGPNGAQGAPVPSIAFDLSNDSAYSYWQPVFYVELYSGQGLAGLAYVSVDQFRSGDRRHIDLRLFGDTLSVSDIRLIPTINVFDSASFIAPGQ